MLPPVQSEEKGGRAIDAQIFAFIHTYYTWTNALCGDKYKRVSASVDSASDTDGADGSKKQCAISMEGM